MIGAGDTPRYLRIDISLSLSLSLSRVALYATSFIIRVEIKSK
jgi:hypothetical protein